MITSPANAIASEGEAFSYIATAADIDGPGISISFADFASWMSPRGDTIAGIPPIGSQDTSFAVIASDGSLADTLVVVVDVQLANRPPQITSAGNVSATEDVLFTYTATASDPDGQTPMISFVNRPSWMAVSGDTISGTPLESYQDTSFTVIASDGILADTLEVSVDVIPINDAPYLTSASSDTAEVGIPFYYLATAIDPDGTTPAISFANYASWMNVSGSAIMGVPPTGSVDTSFMAIADDGQYADSLLVNVLVIGACEYSLGDVNGSGIFNGIDVTYMVQFFKGGSPPTVECNCPPYGLLFAQGDVNGTCSFNGIDVSFSVIYFKGGADLIPCDACPPGGPAIVRELPSNSH
jgi:hypothetical protein